MAELVGEIKGTRERANLLRDPGTLRMDAVVQVGHYEIQAVTRPGGNKEIQQRNRVRSARDRYQDTPAVQLEALQAGSESVEKAHA